MENNEQIDWEEIRKKIGVMKLKMRRGLHRFDRKYKVSQNCKRLVLAAALKVVASLAPGNAALAQTPASPAGEEKPKTEQLLAMATPAAMDMNAAWARLNEYIDERQKEFAMGLSSELAENIGTVREGKKRGRKTATLRELFGSVDSRYYCAISGLRTIEELSKKKDFPEYDFLLKCIKNPHSCLSVIDGLSKFYGDDCKTSNIRQTLKKEQEAAPNSVFIVLLNSRANSSSGKHFVIVTPEFAADTIVYADNHPKMQVFGFNSEVIDNVDSYFTGTRNRGHVYNLTEMGRDRLIELFYSGKITLDRVKAKDEKLVHYEPVSLGAPTGLQRKYRGASR